VERLKRAYPRMTVVFGGLNYPGEARRQEQWLREHPAADFHVVKEREVAFLALVEALGECRLDFRRVKERDLPGAHTLRPDGSFHSPEPAPRVRDLSSFPSPHLSGRMDEFFDGRLMPLLTTNRGCPFSCTFCAEGVLHYNKVNRFAAERISEEAEFIGRRIASLGEAYRRRELYISDSNFGMYPEDLETARILDGEMTLTASVQSLDPEVLANIRRKNIHAEALLQTAMSASEVGANSYSDIILGLPGDSLRAHVETLRQVVDARLDYVNTYQLRLQEDCEMTRDDYRSRFQLKGRFRILTRSYGNYRYADGEVLPLAEVEEVCVEGQNLSFSDYQAARRIHLLLVLFYNDRFFEGILRLLDHAGVGRYAWLEAINRHVEDQPGLRGLLAEFEEATRSELWEDREPLLRSVSSPEVIERYVSGELGANLLGKYRILAILRHLEVFGTSIMARYKQMTRTPVKSLYREAAYV